MEESEPNVPRLDDMPRLRFRLEPDVSCLEGESLPLTADVVRGGKGGPWKLSSSSRGLVGGLEPDERSSWKFGTGPSPLELLATLLCLGGAAEIPTPFSLPLLGLSFCCFFFKP